MRIAIDGMGGDNAPQAVINGVIQALNEYNDLEFYITGPEAVSYTHLKNATEGLWELMRIENLSKGVKLNFNDDDKLIIELSIMVEYGTKISVIANNIIQKVRYSCLLYTSRCV